MQQLGGYGGLSGFELEYVRQENLKKVFNAEWRPSKSRAAARSATYESDQVFNFTKTDLDVPVSLKPDMPKTPTESANYASPSPDAVKSVRSSNKFGKADNYGQDESNQYCRMTGGTITPRRAYVSPALGAYARRVPVHALTDKEQQRIAKHEAETDAPSGVRVTPTHKWGPGSRPTTARSRDDACGKPSPPPNLFALSAHRSGTLDEGSAAGKPSPAPNRPVTRSADNTPTWVDMGPHRSPFAGTRPVSAVSFTQRTRPGTSARSRLPGPTRAGITGVLRQSEPNYTGMSAGLAPATGQASVSPFAHRPATVQRPTVPQTPGFAHNDTHGTPRQRELLKSSGSMREREMLARTTSSGRLTPGTLQERGQLYRTHSALTADKTKHVRVPYAPNERYEHPPSTAQEVGFRARESKQPHNPYFARTWYGRKCCAETRYAHARIVGPRGHAGYVGQKQN